MELGQTRWNGWGFSGHEDPLAVSEPAWRWLAQAFGMPALLATPPRDLSSMTLAPSRLSAHAVHELSTLLGHSGVQQNGFDRARHAAGRGLVDLLRLRGGDLSAAPDAVLYPRNESDVLATLKLCAELDIAVVPFGGGTGNIAPLRGNHAAVAAINLADLNRVLNVDMMSGLAEVEAGITGPALERQLALRGMMLGHHPENFEFSSLGGWIAAPSAGQEEARYGDITHWLQALRVATPQGLMTLPAQLAPLMLGSRGALGVITAATVRLRAMPEMEEQRAWLFPDFASGLAAMREARRHEVPHAFLRLYDDGQTRFLQALERADRDWNLRDHFFDIYLSVRRMDSSAARLVAGFAGSSDEVRAARKRFDALARRLGAVALGTDKSWPEQRFAFGYRRDTMLDRGVGLDSLELSARWTDLPFLYVAVRSALKQAMRRHAPRAGAHGLVFCHVGPARLDGATLTFRWAYPRILDGEIAQAQNIRQAAIAASTTHAQGDKMLEQQIWRSVKAALDPRDILPGRL